MAVEGVFLFLCFLGMGGFYWLHHIMQKNLILGDEEVVHNAIAPITSVYRLGLLPPCGLNSY